MGIPSTTYIYCAITSLVWQGQGNIKPLIFWMKINLFLSHMFISVIFCRVENLANKIPIYSFQFILHEYVIQHSCWMQSCSIRFENMLSNSPKSSTKVQARKSNCSFSFFSIRIHIYRLTDNDSMETKNICKYLILQMDPCETSLKKNVYYNWNFIYFRIKLILWLFSVSQITTNTYLLLCF